MTVEFIPTGDRLERGKYSRDLSRFDRMFLWTMYHSAESLSPEQVARRLVRPTQEPQRNNTVSRLVSEIHQPRFKKKGQHLIRKILAPEKWSTYQMYHDQVTLVIPEPLTEYSEYYEYSPNGEPRRIDMIINPVFDYVYYPATNQPKFLSHREIQALVELAVNGSNPLFSGGIRNRINVRYQQELNAGAVTTLMHKLKKAVPEIEVFESNSKYHAYRLLNAAIRINKHNGHVID